MEMTSIGVEVKKVCLQFY